MPELPEVESVRRGLVPLVGARVERVRLHRRDVLTLPGEPIGGWARNAGTPPPLRSPGPHLLRGARITSLGRLGKLLWLAGDDARRLAVRLGMSGALDLVEPGDTRPAPPHTHAEWTFDTGARLRFVDPRRFGGLWAYPDEPSLHAALLAPMGFDALETTPDRLRAVLAGRRPLKALLLDQSRLAGVGNIYADEALFRARIRPDRPASSLTPDETTALAGALVGVLTQAVEQRGSTIRTYRGPDGQAGGFASRFRVYSRGGRPCTVCETPLQQAIIAQRTTVWCGCCQA